MDDIVRQAMAKWPNVPHCYGWLALDARGNWRMRDERVQAAGLAGDKIVHPALLAFINRNYTHDESGCWYFQNGPQRVYVDLEAAPYIVRSDPLALLIDHTGQPWRDPDQAWLTPEGIFVLRAGEKIAQLDDRDLAQCIASLELDGATVDDPALIAWLNDATGAGVLNLHIGEKMLGVGRISGNALPEYFGFVDRPRPAA